MIAAYTCHLQAEEELCGGPAAEPEGQAGEGGLAEMASHHPDTSITRGCPDTGTSRDCPVLGQ